MKSLVEHTNAVMAWADPLLAPADPSNVPNPSIQAPPGTIGDKINTMLGWVRYLATAAAVAGILMTAGIMALAHRRGDDSQVSRLGWVLAACVLIGGAPWLVGALI